MTPPPSTAPLPRALAARRITPPSRELLTIAREGQAFSLMSVQTEKKVVKRLLASKGILARLFVRHTPALDKQACTAKWSRFGQALRKAGLRLVHEESFYVELNLSALPDPRATLRSEENQSANDG